MNSYVYGSTISSTVLDLDLDLVLDLVAGRLTQCEQRTIFRY